MSLPEVLSAVRSLILDGHTIPDTPEARTEFYAQHFPGMTAIEREDLAKVPARKFRTYANSIYSGQSGILKEKFEVSFALLVKHIENFSGFDFVQELHHARPWKGNSTEALAINFVEYLASEKFVHIPALQEIAQLEYAVFTIMRAPDDPYPPQKSLRPSDLQALTIGELLACSFAVPHYIGVLNFSHDVLHYRESYYANDSKLPTEPPTARKQTAIVARSDDHYTRPIEVESYVGDFIAAVPRSKLQLLESFAQVFLENSAESETEAETCERFLLAVAELVNIGALTIQR